MRYDHRKHNSQEDVLGASEFELCKTVSDKGTNKGLDESGRSRQQKRVAECLPVSVGEYCAVDIQREVLGNKSYRYINEPAIIEKKG